MPLSLLAFFAGSTALGAELSLDDLRQGTERATGVIRACESAPPACAEPSTRTALARAFYTVVIDDVVHGRPVQDELAANVRHLDPGLYARLPSDGRSAAAPARWVQSLTGQPAPTAVIAPVPLGPTPRPRPSAAPTPAPEAQVVAPVEPGMPAALALLEARDFPAASEMLLALAGDGDQEALLHLATAAEGLSLPSMALVLEIAWLQAAGDDNRVPDVSRHTVHLATALGSRRPLTGLAQNVNPSRWARDVRSDGWLALGQAWQASGDFSRALKAYADIDHKSPAYVEGEYRTGLIYWQSAQPWEAIAAFRNAWEQDSDNPDLERTREMALWNTARLYEELQRGPEALTRYEVLAITTSPLSDRAAHRCAWVAVDGSDAALAKRWLAPSLPRGVFRPDDDLLRARIAFLEGRTAAAAGHLDRAQPALSALNAELAELVSHRETLWAQLQAADRNPVLAARLDADPELASFRASLAALRADRRKLASHPDATWRADVGRALDQKLLAEEVLVREQATASAYAQVVDIQRELADLARKATLLRKQLGG